MQSSWPESRQGHASVSASPSTLLGQLARLDLWWVLPLLGLALPRWPLAWPALMLAWTALPLRLLHRRGPWLLAGPLSGPWALFLLALLAGTRLSLVPGLAEEALRSYLAVALLFLLVLDSPPLPALKGWLGAGTLALLSVAPLAFAPALEENRKILAFNAWAFELGSHLPLRFFHAPHPNGLAVGLAVALPLLMAAALDGATRRERASWLLLSAASLLFVGLSASRTAWIGAGLGLAVLVALRDGRSLRWSLDVAALTLGLALLLGRPTPGDFRWLSSTWSLMERRQQWANTLEMLAPRPVTGVGLGSFPVVYPATMGPGDLRPHDTPNNAYLQLYADGGLPALLALGWFVWGLARLLAGMRPARGRWGRWEAGLAGSLAVLGWSGLFETSTVVAFIWTTGSGGYHYLASPVPFFLAGFALLVYRRRQERPPIG